MVASNDTVKKVLEVVLRHVTDRRVVDAIIQDLKKVDGNQSFKDTVLRIEKANL